MTIVAKSLMTKKRDKILKKVEFSAKKRKYWIKRAKTAQFGVKKAKFATFWRHEKVGQSKKKWDSRKFGSKKRNYPSKIGTVGKYV